MKKSKVLCLVLFSGCFLQGKVSVLYWIPCLIYIQKKNIKVITSHHALHCPPLPARHQTVATLSMSLDGNEKYELNFTINQEGLKKNTDWWSKVPFLHPPPQRILGASPTLLIDLLNCHQLIWMLLAALQYFAFSCWDLVLEGKW